MTQNEFRKHVEKTLNELKLYAELHSGTSLPNDFEIKFLNTEKTSASGKDNVIKLITNQVYLSETEIYPCVDLIVTGINENRISLKGLIAGFVPRKFGKGWSNRPGPFIYGVNNELINKKINQDSKEFKNMLYEKGLLHYKDD